MRFTGRSQRRGTLPVFRRQKKHSRRPRDAPCRQNHARLQQPRAEGPLSCPIATSRSRPVAGIRDRPLWSNEVFSHCASKLGTTGACLPHPLLPVPRRYERIASPARAARDQRGEIVPAEGASRSALEPHSGPTPVRGGPLRCVPTPHSSSRRARVERPSSAPPILNAEPNRGRRGNLLPESAQVRGYW